MEDVVYKEKEVEEMMKELKEKVKEAVKKVKVKRGRKRGNDWWTKECGEKKKEMKKKLKEWRAGKERREEYMKARNNFKEACEKEKERKRKEEMEEIKNVKNEKEVWKWINKERRRERQYGENGISIEKWKEHFKELLDGRDEREEEMRTVEDRTEQRAEDEQEEEITREEIDIQIERLKKGKAAGGDGIQNEAWMYGGEKVRERLRELINRVWRGGEMPDEWRESEICPVRKKVGKNEVRNYRGVNLLCTAYKVYAMCLGERLMKEAEEKCMIQDGQAGFRKGRGVIDNAYILQHLVRRELKKEGGKLYALFVDLEAAFDRVDREELWKNLRKRGVNEKLVRRMEEIYRETRNRVKVGEKRSECFWTRKGVRQGCPLSPILFTIYMGDMEKWLRGRQSGGIELGKGRVWALAYADDLVVVAKDERNMREVMKELEIYLDRKKMIMNVDKTKIMIFNRGGRRKKEEEWKWKGKKVERVKEIKYLGYVFDERGNERAHVRELVKKANKVMAAVWGIGERKFGHDFDRRVKMFDSMVKSVLMYGAEIWGWKEYDEIERVQEKYMKWTLGVDRETPGYIVREEVKREKMRVETGKRAVKYEERIEERQGCELLKECLREKKQEALKGRKNDRVKYYERNGYASTEIERMRNEGMRTYEWLRKRDQDIERQERRERIKESRYNERYMDVLIEKVPKYLRRMSVKEKRMIARFRCGNEERECKFWMEESERRCRICGEEKETIEHMLKECQGLKEENMGRKDVLNEDGRGLEWMKVVDTERKRVNGDKIN